jgi:2,5-diamino-6-(ribosylamino)-4(3H)-pyrimidinone 5'-phosphate reductase
MAILLLLHRKVALFTLFLVAASSAASPSSPFSTTEDLTIQTIIDDVLAWQKEHVNSKQPAITRPFVTLTYAQSLDAKIALVDEGDDKKSTSSSNFGLSDTHSLRMTHALRSIHDGILVGGKTLSVDNPRLSNRLWTTTTTTCQEQYPSKQPRPIVLDTHLNHIRALWKSNCRATNVIICCSQEAFASVDTKEVPDSFELLSCSLNSETGRVDLTQMLQQLREKYNIQSVMVEGGASVLTSFYMHPELLDCVCITIAPKLLLWRGLSATHHDLKNAETVTNNFKAFLDDTSDVSFASTKFLLLGKDSIFLGRHQN